MAGHLNPSRPAAQTLCLRRSLVHAATPRKNTCIATMAKNKPNYNAKFARRPSKLTIVLENHLKLNTSVPTANMLYSVGKSICTSLLISAVMIIASIASMLLKNSTLQNEPYLKQNLHNSNFVTFTANIYSRPKSLNIPRRLNRSSILPKSIILKMSLASSSPSSSPLPSPPEKPPTFFARSLTSTSPTKPSSTTPRPPRSTVTNST